MFKNIKINLCLCPSAHCSMGRGSLMQGYGFTGGEGKLLHEAAVWAIFWAGRGKDLCPGLHIFKYLKLAWGREGPADSLSNRYSFHRAFLCPMSCKLALWGSLKRGDTRFLLWWKKLFVISFLLKAGVKNCYASLRLSSCELVLKLKIPTCGIRNKGTTYVVS